MGIGEGPPATYSPEDTGLTAHLVVTALQDELPSAKPRNGCCYLEAPHLGGHQATAGQNSRGEGLGDFSETTENKAQV